MGAAGKDAGTAAQAIGLSDDRPAAGARATIRKRSVTIVGHKTSLSLEQDFWDELKRLAEIQGVSINTLVAAIDAAAPGNLSSAIRLYVLDKLRTEAGRKTKRDS